MVMRTTQKTPFIARRSYRLLSLSSTSTTNTNNERIKGTAALHSSTNDNNAAEKSISVSDMKVKIKLSNTAYVDTNNSDVLLASIKSPLTTPSPSNIKKTSKNQESNKIKRKRSNSTDSNSSRSSKSPSKSKIEYQIYSTDLEQINPSNKWIDLEAPPSELRPSTCLTTGQCFSWHVVSTETSDTSTKKSAWGVHDAIEWVGPIGNSVISIRETPTTTYYRLVHTNDVDLNEKSIKTIIQDYFQLSTINLTNLYKIWSNCDTKRFKPIAECIPGVRLLRQDPFECLISFLCSSNNNIPRITLILSRIRGRYGYKLMDVPQRSAHDTASLLSIYSFPRLNDLLQATENELRDLGLGYRAKYIHQSCKLLGSLGGESYLHKLRNIKDSKMVQTQLIQFSGIGRKVADCIALFSLDVNDAIPVDVHVWHIACRDYDSTLLDDSVKSLTPSIYNRVGDLFRDIFGNEYAGWAHSILFVAELPSFRSVLPGYIVEDMDKFRQEERERKRNKRS